MIRHHCRARALRCLVLALSMLCLGTLSSPPLRAGGGPENVFLLVNSSSEASQTIANEFCHLRQIPAVNVLYLNWTGSKERIDAEPFRNQILNPALAAIKGRGLNDQIDYLIYSSDFPWSINVQPDFPDVKFANHLRPVASLNGATYLGQLVGAKDQGLVGLHTNSYARVPSGAQGDVPSVGFHRRRLGLSATGQPVASGYPYILSMMLGVTSGRGNTVAEVLSYLRRSATADGTHPDGTIYFMKNDNIRSTTRHWAFAGIVKQLQQLGVGAEVLQGRVPSRKLDVQGLMVGTHKFNWKKTRSVIKPGAICEHFTSCGGDLKEGAPQTPLTEFLRYGAAGASGTVVEPMSLQPKFPLATIQVHYVRGCTLAEAFYQSVLAPYQLLIVGDPLCRPWAKIPQVSVEGLQAGQTLKGTISFRATAKVEGDAGIGRLELLVDGRRSLQVPADGNVTLNTEALGDGYHELRVVATEAGPIQSQGRLILPVTVNNHDRQIELSATTDGAKFGERIKLAARCPGALLISIRHNLRPVGFIRGEEGEVEIDTRQLGRGPVSLQAVGEGKQPVRSRPIQLRIE